MTGLTHTEMCNDLHEGQIHQTLCDALMMGVILYHCWLWFAAESGRLSVSKTCQVHAALGLAILLTHAYSTSDLSYLLLFLPIQSYCALVAYYPKISVINCHTMEEVTADELIEVDSALGSNPSQVRAQSPIGLRSIYNMPEIELEDSYKLYPTTIHTPSSESTDIVLVSHATTTQREEHDHDLDCPPEARLISASHG